MIHRLSSYVRSNSVTIGTVTIALAFMGILFFQAAATSQLQRQVAQQDEIIRQIREVTNRVDKSASDRTEQIDKLVRHIDCVALFFTQENRSNTVIEDINACTLRKI